MRRARTRDIGGGMTNGRLLVQRFRVAGCRGWGGLEGAASTSAVYADLLGSCSMGRVCAVQLEPSPNCSPAKAGAQSGSPPSRGNKVCSSKASEMRILYHLPGGGRGPVGTSEVMARNVLHYRPPTGPRPSPGWCWTGVYRDRKCCSPAEAGIQGYGRCAAWFLGSRFRGRTGKGSTPTENRSDRRRYNFALQRNVAAPPGVQRPC